VYSVAIQYATLEVRLPRKKKTWRDILGQIFMTEAQDKTNEKELFLPKP
jgi:hypothetical protein